jgi:hypothetical protein
MTPNDVSVQGNEPKCHVTFYRQCVNKISGQSHQMSDWGGRRSKISQKSLTYYLRGP